MMGGVPPLEEAAAKPLNEIAPCLRVGQKLPPCKRGQTLTQSAGQMAMDDRPTVHPALPGISFGDFSHKKIGLDIPVCYPHNPYQSGKYPL
jgi:hypothetical protein